jgi:hypothetical protein
MHGARLTEETPMANQGSDEVHTNTGLPRELRLQLDDLRLARARRDGCRPPSVKALIVEALQALIGREKRR